MNDPNWFDLIERVRANGYDFGVVTPDEAAAIWGAVRDNDYALLLEGMVRQASSGQRCSVCLMTSAQAQDAGYDCIREC